MQEMPHGLVWLASYPKSGNTWIRILLSNLFAKADRPESINDLTLRDGIASSRNLFDYHTLVDSHLLTDAEADLLRPAFHDDHAASAPSLFTKVHDSYGRIADGTPLLGRGASKALYIVRDPRDVAVSFSFHQGTSLEATVDFLCDPDAELSASAKQFRQHLSDWSGHARSWLDQNDIPVHMVRYEDLRADTLGALCAALDFLGIPHDREAAARAVRHADFDELRQQESSQGFRERTRHQKVFFREGQSGGWRRHLSEAQAEKIETAHAAMMARLGYDR